MSDIFTDSPFYLMPEQSSCHRSADGCRRSMWRIFCAQGHDKRDTFITLNNKIGKAYPFGIHCFLLYNMYFIDHEIHLAKLNGIQISHYITCSYKIFSLVLHLIFAESKYFSLICYRFYWELVFLCHTSLHVLYFLCVNRLGYIWAFSKLRIVFTQSKIRNGETRNIYRG